MNELLKEDLEAICKQKKKVSFSKIMLMINETIEAYKSVKMTVSRESSADSSGAEGERREDINQRIFEALIYMHKVKQFKDMLSEIVPDHETKKEFYRLLRENGFPTLNSEELKTAEGHFKEKYNEYIQQNITLTIEDLSELIKDIFKRVDPRTIVEVERTARVAAEQTLDAEHAARVAAQQELEFHQAYFNYLQQQQSEAPGFQSYETWRNNRIASLKGTELAEGQPTPDKSIPSPSQSEEVVASGSVTHKERSSLFGASQQRDVSPSTSSRKRHRDSTEASSEMSDANSVTPNPK